MADKGRTMLFFMLATVLHITQRLVSDLRQPTTSAVPLEKGSAPQGKTVSLVEVGSPPAKSEVALARSIVLTHEMLSEKTF